MSRVPEIPQAFRGCRVALPESRQIDILAGLLERRGATVTRCPLVSIHDSPDQDGVVAWIDRFLADGSMRDLIVLTGEGIARLHAASERHGRETAFLRKLERTRLIVRGPKPGRVLKRWGLQAEVQADRPTSDGVIATLKNLDQPAPRTGVVLYGTEPNIPLIRAVHEIGSEPVPVAPYVYASESETEAVLELVEQLADGRTDVILFTAQPQINRLLRIARNAGRDDALQAGLARAVVAAIGPVMAEHLEGLGIRVDVMPGRRFFMHPMVDALAEHLQRREAVS
ncbi:uroporphyrinogen-III synthase [Guyparkeria halophila]|uniref:Uroporphyrinogen-III synthase n=1 Tax=Guyparkeria halophila TaxID=47960 RepID=A0ABZ0Z1G7_9GAMM|nr:uroporphyrinogen-III synthase [Guyparkeria halophila]WQH17272.1 uroporphyrinogen-III synthase [Guyparkeria halophila]